MQLTNNTDIPLTLAVWLAHDEYDYVKEEKYISATSLMKPLRHIILPSRIKAGEKVVPDVSEFIARALGHSLHDSIEKSWTKGYERNLAKLGFPESTIKRIRINPTPEEAKEPGVINIYLEQRSIREHRGYKIGGKFDMIADGMIQDNKSTSVYSWTKGNRDEEHQLQGSIYRWLNVDKVTEDFIRINYIFTDWAKGMARGNPNYPQQRVEYKDIKLLSLEDTERWIDNKIALIEKHQKTPEHLLPECTPQELWMDPPQYKYYSDPAKISGKSTKNFDSKAEADQYWRVEKASKGIVITKPGAAKRCGYCDAYEICTQKNKYNHD